jgi:hypothetical protein
LVQGKTKGRLTEVPGGTGTAPKIPHHFAFELRNRNFLTLRRWKLLAVISELSSSVVQGSRMARFYIHFRNRDKIDKDDSGIDLPSLAEAREAALVSLRELLAENIHAGSETPVEAAIIADKCGRELMAIPVQDVLPVLLKMSKPASVDIECRAYELWESAGKPEGMAEKFYYLAERELTLTAEQPSRKTK